MTTIIAVQYPDKVVIGADTQTSGESGTIYRHHSTSKIVENGHFLIAGAGDVGPSDIAQYVWNPPTPRGKEWRDLYRFMVRKVVPSLKTCLKENDYKVDNQSQSDLSFTLLFSISGELFDVGEDFSVMRKASGVYGAGSGSNVAIGAILAGASIETALEIAADNDAYTSGPFIFKTQYRDPRAH